jgi:hypothetical protein
MNENRKYINKDKDKDNILIKEHFETYNSWSAVPLGWKICIYLFILLAIGGFIFNIYKYVYCFKRNWEGNFCKGVIFQNSANSLRNVFD